MTHKVLRVYVWTNRDGITVCRWDRHGPAGRRIVLAGGPVDTLDDVQVRALVELLFKEAERKKAPKVVFHCGNEWSRRSCPDGTRGKVLLRFALV